METQYRGIYFVFLDCIAIELQHYHELKLSTLGVEAGTFVRRTGCTLDSAYLYI